MFNTSDPEIQALWVNFGSILIALAVAAGLYTLIMPILDRDKQKARMKSVTSERESLRKAHLESLDKTVSLRGNTGGFVKRIVTSLSLEKLLAAPEIREKLMQGGFRGQRPLQMFYFFRFTVPIVLFVLGLVYFVVLDPYNWPMSRGLLIAVLMLVFGYYAPNIYIKNAADKRQKAIMPAFPDALDLLLICVEAGMSIEVAFGRVANEMASTSIELAEELSLTTAELSYLQSRRQAYENLARRNNHVGIRSVATALVQSERYGTPLATALRTMAAENRQMRVLLAEKKGAALPAKLTVPMILFFLPVLFIVILTPAAMELSGAF